MPPSHGGGSSSIHARDGSDGLRGVSGDGGPRKCERLEAHAVRQPNARTTAVAPRGAHDRRWPHDVRTMPTPSNLQLLLELRRTGCRATTWIIQYRFAIRVMSFDPARLGHPPVTTSSDLATLWHPPATISSNPCVMISMIIFYADHCNILCIPFEDFTMMDMTSLTCLGIFCNNIYAISTIFTLKVDYLYDYKYNTT